MAARYPGIVFYFMTLFKGLLLVYLSFSPLFAMYIGNPSDPQFTPEGIFSSASAPASFRLGYIDDFVYRQKYKQLRIVGDSPSSNTFTQIYSRALLCSLNLKERIDFYGIFGSSCLQLDKEIFTKWQFCWGTGIKLLFCKIGSFSFGTDLKYFQSEYNRISYVVSNGTPFNVIENFTLQYHEWQASLGVSYKTSFISPYIYATYLISELDPQPSIILVRLTPHVLVDAPIASITTEKRWGLCVGATILGSSIATLSVESRMFNQNAVDIKFEIRF